MSKARSSGMRATEPPAGAGKRWSALTWDDLEQWAGHRSVERGRSYERQGGVRDLAVSDEGKLLATVQGGKRYVVSAWLRDRKGDEAPLA